MRVTSVQLQGFQSYTQPTTVQLSRDITILAGRNNVGKSAFLRGLRLPVEGQNLEPSVAMKWQWVMEPSDLDHTFGQDLRELMTGGSPIEDTVMLTADLSAIQPSLTHPPISGADPGVTPRVGSLYVIRSWLDIANMEVASYMSNGSPRLVFQNHGHLTGDTDQAACISRWFTLLNKLCTDTFYVLPRRVGSEPAPFFVQRSLGSDGGNLTPVVATLYNNERQTTFRSLELFITDAFPEIGRLDIVMSGPPGTQPQAEIHVVYGTGAGSQIPLRHCGTGVEQLLMLGTAVLTATSPLLLLIDEPHAFLHPVAERRLLAFMRQHSEHQYVVATHSPVFLNSTGLSDIRLISRDESGSSVTDVGEAGDILDEIGITASDLWSAEAILWMEGGSDQAIAEQVRDEAGVDSANGIRVVAMPDWIRSAGASEKRMLAAIQFCDTVQRAVAPLPVRSIFLFDGDEWPETQKTAIAKASQNRARYLCVREVENLLLFPPAIHAVLSEVCQNAAVQTPTLEQIEVDLKNLLEQLDNPIIYRQPVSGPNPTLVIGSHVLKALWWKWAQADYDKVTDGAALAHVNEFESRVAQPSHRHHEGTRQRREHFARGERAVIPIGIKSLAVRSGLSSGEAPAWAGPNRGRPRRFGPVIGTVVNAGLKLGQGSAMSEAAPATRRSNDEEHYSHAPASGYDTKRVDHLMELPAEGQRPDRCGLQTG